MRLYEFADDDPLRVKLTGVVAQLKEKMMGLDRPIPVDAFIQLLNHNGISIDESDIYDLIKKDPLVNIIQDIEDNQVIFRGQTGPDGEVKPDENEKIIKQMASKQANKLA
jgi:hypothetical protein